VATHLFHLDPHHCFFQFFSFLNYSAIYFFWQFFRVVNFQSRFEAQNNFFGHKTSGKYEFILDLIFTVNSCIPWIDLSNDVSCASNEDSMPKL
jgi:hypothetical protein